LATPITGRSELLRRVVQPRANVWNPEASQGPLVAQLGPFRSDTPKRRLDFRGASSLRQAMESGAEDVIFDRLIALLERAVELCTLPSRNAYGRQIAQVCAAAAELSAELDSSA